MKDTKKYAAALEKELTLVESELKTVGVKNPQNPADWQAVQPDMNITNADENETADTIEEYETNTAILKQLEIRYNEIKGALARIKDGSYGTCSVCKKAIEEARLAANPAATTCEAHMG